ncbi:MAG: SixA phosphatase family protein [Ilumatobacteraceae bacterium]
MTLYLVRHAKAGDRSASTGLDLERPLSKAGWQQAHKLGTRLAAEGATTLVSSPYKRCVQTLEPLAERAGLPISVDRRLTEGAAFEGALDLLGEVQAGAVLCSHGDVIPDTIDALVRRGLDVRSPADWRKATVWVLKRNKRGDFTRAVVWGPP